MSRPWASGAYEASWRRRRRCSSSASSRPWTAAAARLSFAHLILPHRPWRYLPTGQSYVTRAVIQREPLCPLAARPLAVHRRLSAAPPAAGVPRPPDRPTGSASQGGRAVRPCRDRRDGRSRGELPPGRRAARRHSNERRGRRFDTPFRQGSWPAARKDRRLLRRQHGHPPVDRPSARCAHPLEHRRRSRTKLTIYREHDGGSVVIDRRRLEKLRDAAVARRLELFAGGDPFRIGPHRELGRRAAPRRGDERSHSDPGDPRRPGAVPRGPSTRANDSHRRERRGARCPRTAARHRRGAERADRRHGMDDRRRRR